MPVELNHTIVHARDQQASAEFLAGILGIEVSEPVGHFTPLVLANGVTLDYDRADDVRPQHYAFLLDEDEFDEAFERLTAAGVTYFADPGHRQPDQINHRQGGRGVYFNDPDGHNMELLTRS